MKHLAEIIAVLSGSPLGYGLVIFIVLAIISIADSCGRTNFKVECAGDTCSSSEWHCYRINDSLECYSK